MAKKGLKYKPVKNFISVDTGIVQASTLLDLAALHAIENKDYEHAVVIAEAWISLSVAMGGVLSEMKSDEHDEEEEPMASKRQSAPVGFGVTAKELDDYARATKD